MPGGGGTGLPIDTPVLIILTPDSLNTTLQVSCNSCQAPRNSDLIKSKSELSAPTNATAPNVQKGICKYPILRPRANDFPADALIHKSSKKTQEPQRRWQSWEKRRRQVHGRTQPKNPSLFCHEIPPSRMVKGQGRLVRALHAATLPR